MPALLKFLSLLPDLIKLGFTYAQTQKLKEVPREELKKELNEIEKAMKDGDAKKLNDIVNASH